jgi:hypothetical protein
VQVKEFTLKEFGDISRAVEVVNQIMDADPNLDRSMQIRRDVDKALSVYQYQGKLTFRSNINNFFVFILLSITTLRSC